VRLFKHGAAVFGHEVLRQICYYGVFRGCNLAACGRACAGNNLKQSGFAGSILAHQGYTVFLVNLKRDVTEQGCAAKFNGKSIN